MWRGGFRLFRTPFWIPALFPKRKWKGREDTIYLTFDDGPNSKTDWLLDYLKMQDVQATFFWTGARMLEYPDMLDRAVAEGHSVGHHGYEHLPLVKCSVAEFKTDWNRSKQIVPHRLYRPPYGKISRAKANIVLQQEAIIMWSWMSYDWDHRLSVQMILDRFERDVKGGDIVVFHENDKTVSRIEQIIPAVVRIVHNKGLNFAALSKI